MEVYTVNITSHDSSIRQLSLSTLLEVRVIDVNEPPAYPALTSVSVPENSPIGTVIGKFISVDRDRNQTITFVLMSEVTDRVKIDPRTDNLITKRLFDYEEKHYYDFLVAAYDSGHPRMFATGVLAFAIEDVNEAPTAIELSHSIILEYSPGVSRVTNGTLIGYLTAVDQDFEEDHTFTILHHGVQDESLQCMSLTRDSDGKTALRVGNTFCFDYETREELYIRVKVTDKGNLTLNTWQRIVIQDIDDAPEGVHLSATTVAEHSVVGTVVGTITAIDPDKNDKHFFTQLSGFEYFKLEGNLVIRNKKSH